MSFSRLLVACAAFVLAINFAEANAQGFGYGYGYGPGYGSNSGWGYPRGTTGYRFGYVYDPYASGSFRAPDLMDDPSFRAQMQVGRRYQSRQSTGASWHSHRPAPVLQRYSGQAVDLIEN